jgi:SNF2 family DNA or RNA helicase
MFKYKTTPLPYQDTTFEETKDYKAWALFLEQGLGKTKVALDTAAYLALKGEINGLLVVAPNGVYRNWLKKEIPKHFPFSRYAAFSYDTKRAATKKHKQELNHLNKTTDFSILVMSYHAFLTPTGKKAAKDFMLAKKLMYVLDEATRIKTAPGRKKGKTSKIILQSAEYCPYKRILTGTPIANSPLDIWTQIQFLDPTFWAKYRLNSYYIFKHYFGDIIKKKSNLGHEFDFVKGYRNLEELNTILKTISTRLTKEEVLPDLPPKLYSTRYFNMNPEQKRVYEELVQSSLAEVKKNKFVTCELAIVLLLRLQQVICGYVPAEGLDGSDPSMVLLGDTNPRLELLKEICEDTPHQGIIWARFTKDIDLIMDMLGDDAVRYDGAMDQDQRGIGLDKFMNGEVKWFVSNPAVGGEGLTLTNANTVIYYNNSFKLSERLQSEDRAHRIGTKSAVLYYDILCENTVDEEILEALLNKFNISKLITGDILKSWL